MADLPVDEKLAIQSHKGSYSVFAIDRLDEATSFYEDDPIFIVDSNVSTLHQEGLSRLFSNKPRIIRVEALEKNKSLEKMPDYIESMIGLKARRHHKLVAIGGGIVQDITCFLAATIFRGMAWDFFPSTLLAQADSCIGSKSSINCRDTKNILGTFTPPKRIFLYSHFLKTLSPTEICSGIGEMLKVHALDGPAAFKRIAIDYEKILADPHILADYILASLQIKKSFIEEDEFDCGIRNLLNYGHTFGHAIESATHFQIPHGIAVSIGMDMANFVSYRLGRSNLSVFDSMHKTLHENYERYKSIPIDTGLLIAGMKKDKKNNSNDSVSVIIPNAKGQCEKFAAALDGNFTDICNEYLDVGRKN
jgi:3-dehydroquinate synthase